VQTYLILAQIVVDIALIVLVVLQAQDEGLGSMFGGSDMGVFRTRRGAEKTMYQATIALAVVFLLLSILAVIVFGA
jgi:preprotein translocase subunit SecG